MLLVHAEELVYTININKDIHLEHSEEMEKEISKLEVPAGVKKIIIDMQHVRFIDSTGIGFLITWLHPLSARYDIVIGGSNENVRKILDICKLDQFTEVL